MELADGGHGARTRLSWFNDPGVVPAARAVDRQSVFNYTRATTIYGGSNEIQKNIIAKLILGLPQPGKKSLTYGLLRSPKTRR